MYCVAGIILVSFHLATLFLGERIVQDETRWRHRKHFCISIFLNCHRYAIKHGAAAAGDYFWNFIFFFFFSFSSCNTYAERRVSVMTPWISHWHILNMLWMFLQLYEDDKVSCVQVALLANQPPLRNSGRQITDMLWEHSKHLELGGWVGVGVGGLRHRRLHWIQLTLAPFFFFCHPKKCLVKRKLQQLFMLSEQVQEFHIRFFFCFAYVIKRHLVKIYRNRATQW